MGSVELFAAGPSPKRLRLISNVLRWIRSYTYTSDRELKSPTGTFVRAVLKTTYRPSALIAGAPNRRKEAFVGVNSLVMTFFTPTPRSCTTMSSCLPCGERLYATIFPSALGLGFMQLMH